MEPTKDLEFCRIVFYRRAIKKKNAKLYQMVNSIYREKKSENETDDSFFV